MRTLLFPILFLLFMGCEQDMAGPDRAEQDVQRPQGRHLGHIQSLYPVLAEDGQTWDIEIQLDSLTILASLSEVQNYASDSVGKALLRTRATKWYSRDGDCLFAAGKTGCLKIEKGL
jgi:hypothetical protein